ncbi:MAG: efflux RND transporter permease subunit [Alphaproteobacteria bacterium]|nr:efflux RND transporter permease subunit [Alphaproteobacteria bacterium]
MKISEICIQRPVFSMVVNFIIILLGVVSYDRLTIREYPNIDVPVVTVETNYLGASAKIIESQVTKPLEDSLSGIEGIDFIKSISRSEQSQITVQFRLSREADAAASDVRDRVARARDLLPEEVDEPIVAKVEADAQPIIWMALNSDTHSPLDISEAADLIVQDRVQTLPGVANVRLFAERRYSMRIWVDRERLAGYNLTTQDVENALRTQNVEIPAGRIESTQREFTVVSQTDLNTPEQFGDVILRETEAGHLVRMKDVARVAYGPEEERSIARFNSKPSIALGVVKQSIANPLEISSAIRKELPRIQKNLPEGMTLSIAYDSSVFIDQSIKNVFKTIIEAVLLVVLTIFFFLRTMRATLIPLVTIPISLIGTLFIMYTLGFSINTLTLLAMVIAIGLVVDDAIVVLENIYRHIEEGMDAFHAAVKGMREIGFAVVAMTLTLATVFVPVSLTPGRTGQLFVEFAITLAGAVIISGLTALTLSPMMCSRLLKPQHNAPKWSKKIEGWIVALERSYKALLTASLRFRPRMLVLAAVTFVGAYFLMGNLQSQLSPTEDRGVIFGVGISPEGSTIWYSDDYAKQMEKILQSVPEANWNFIAVGFPFVTQTFTVLGLTPWEERHRSSLDIIGEISPQLFGIPGTLNFAINPASLGQGARSQPVEFVIQTTDSYEALDKIVNGVMAKMMANPNFQAPDSDLKLNKPEIRVTMDRDKLATMGIGVSDVGRSLETMLGGRQVTRFKRGSEQYDVLVKIEDDKRRTPTDLTAIYVRGREGEMVPLSNIVSLQETVAPRELNHFNKLRAATITANLAPDYGLGQALEFMEATTREVATDVQTDVGGQSREFRESSASMGMLFGLALAFIYLVLAAQFESFRDPVIILLTVPLAMAGALLAMNLTGGTLNVYSQIGLVALMGLISKHGIMIVEFANQLQDRRGLSKIEAIIESCSIRMRPILMTTAATVLGALPLAIASGAGAEARQAIGWVIVGGMTIGTLFTLFIVPTFYLLLSRRKPLLVIDESKIV